MEPGMNKLFSRFKFYQKRFLILLLFGALSCTDLEVPVDDRVADFWLTPQQIEQGVAHAYAQLRDYAPTGFGGAPNVYNLHEMSTDEIIVPIRGLDWHDQSIWEELWKHKWTPNSLAVQDGWKFIFNGIDGINQIIESVTHLDPPPENLALILAELRILRAFYYYQALDLFGNVPIVKNWRVAASDVETKSRADVFAFVEKEILESVPILSQEVSDKTYGRVTQWFAFALLAKLYINAEVYIETQRWSDCIEACDAVLNSGKYVLEDNFFENFTIDNEASRENIFAIPYDFNAGLIFFGVQVFTLHYSSGETFGLQFGGFNGFCSTAEYLKIFDDNDIRKKMFLVGQQYVDQIEDEEHLQYDRAGNPLIFDPVITSFNAEETSGARCAKWEFNRTGWSMSNDFAVYRLADIILMKAEAQLRNGDPGGALLTINQKFGGVSIRSRTGLPDFSAEQLNLDEILAERARELSWEGHRRNDLIRFDHFLDARIPEKGVSQSYYKLFPIPQSELDKNRYLHQNPGY